MKTREPITISTPTLEVLVSRLTAQLEKVTAQLEKVNKESLENKKLATSAMRDCVKLKIEIQRLTTRMISNENDVRHISPKR